MSVKEQSKYGKYETGTWNKLKHGVLSDKRSHNANIFCL